MDLDLNATDLMKSKDMYLSRLKEWNKGMTAQIAQGLTEENFETSMKMWKELTELLERYPDYKIALTQALFFDKKEKQLRVENTIGPHVTEPSI